MRSQFLKREKSKITESEYDVLRNLRCQIGTSSWGGTRYPPYVFTQEGVVKNHV